MKPTVKLSGNWHEFLRIDENKTEVFSVLSEQIVDNLTADISKTVVMTKDTSVLCNKNVDLSPLTDCNLEEADTRIAWHIADVAQTMADHSFTVRSSDKDVLIILMYHVNINSTRVTNDGCVKLRTEQQTVHRCYFVGR